MMIVVKPSYAAHKTIKALLKRLQHLFSLYPLPGRGIRSLLFQQAAAGIPICIPLVFHKNRVYASFRVNHLPRP